MGDRAATRPVLVEREAECAALERAVAEAVASSGSVVLLEGAAGTGKSRLVAALVESARRAGRITTAVRAVELDASLPFAIARRLLEPPLRAAAGRPHHDPRVEQALAALTRSVRGSSAPLVEGGTAALHAAVRGAEALVDGFGPLVVAIDDVQWSDEPSLQLLVHLADRAHELPIVLAVALRRGELADGRVARFRAAPRAVVLEPRELSAEGVDALVRRRFPGAPADVAQACRRATGGNPFLVGELLEAVAAAGIVEQPDAASRIERLAPRTVIDGVLVRLGRLPAGADRLAHATAVLGDGAHLRQAARLADLAPGPAAAVADALIAADILDARDPLAFRHPLIAAALRQDLGPFTRAELHRRAADLLAAESEHDRAAAHLLLAAPTGDRRVVSRLRAAAAAAAERGDAGAARRLLVRALEEPPKPADRPDLLVALARAETAVGDPQALAHMDEAVASIADAGRAAAALRALARLHHARSDFATATMLAGQALDRAGEQAPDRERLRATWLLAAALDPATVSAFAQATGELVAASQAGSSPDDPELQAILALLLMSFYGDPAEAARLAGEAVDGEIRTNDDGLGLGFGYSLPALLHAGELRRLDAAATRALEWARERGTMLGAAAAALWRGHARLRLGNLDGAEADAEVALAPWRSGWNWNAPQAYALLGRLQLERGAHDAAREAIAAGAAIDVPHPPHLYATGLVRLAGGDGGGALDAFRRAGDLLESVWGVESPAIVAWRSGAALAALHAGLPGEAATLASVEVEQARRTGVPALLGGALRSDGLVAGGERGIERLREGLAALRGSEDALETVRTQVELGAALRRAGARSAARAELAAARDGAERLGLPALAARAEEEQKASGGRPRRTRLSGAAALTPSERRIAERAAAGASTRRIAAELFLAAKTVEWHLGNVFRKVGVASRSELAGALGDEREPGP